MKREAMNTIEMANSQIGTLGMPAGLMRRAPWRRCGSQLVGAQGLNQAWITGGSAVLS